MKIPRVLIAAPKSGSGKTLITCALLGALKNRQKNVMAYKCGPDYIDPMFHRNVQRIECENIDSFFLGADKTEEFFVKTSKGHDIAVIEGVMGLFDGQNVENEKGSAYEIAVLTKTPIILVIDAHGMSRSMLPLIKGFLDFDREKMIKGIILNRITPAFFGMIKPVIEKELNVPVAGYFPKRADLAFESRHLGLKLPNEIKQLEESLDMAASQFEESCGLDMIIRTAEEAKELRDDFEEAGEQEDNFKETKARAGEFNEVKYPHRYSPDLTLAVARDEAFCFYYGANIRMFEEMGVKIKYFSPIHDEKISKEADGLLLGGGYPEVYLKELSENISMRNSIKEAIEDGIPSLAECGGFMYLHENILGSDGVKYKMAQVIKADAQYKGKLVRFGYVNITEKEPVFLEKGSCIRAHEFHYYDSSDNGNDCIAVKPGSGRSWSCIHEGTNHFWGFPHLYYPSNPDFVIRFAEAMEKRKKSRYTSG
jgi:cobyrinic acid a,c-diamide synthase